MIRACIKHLIFLLTLLFGCFHSTGEVSSSFSTLIEPSISNSVKEKSEVPLEIYDLNIHNYSILFIKPIDAYTSILTPCKYSTVDKIYIIKGNQTLNFKYSYPNANKILDDHRVSVKYVVDA